MLVLATSGCTRTALVLAVPDGAQACSGPVTGSDTRPDAAAATGHDTLPDLARTDTGTAGSASPDAAAERFADGMTSADRPDTADGFSERPDASTFGQFVADAGSVANNWGINPAHDNAQPDDVVASPLTKKWTAHFTGTASYPVVADGRVFVAAAESQPNVRALDVQTGAVLWGPLAIGSKVWLACDAVNLYALDGDGNLSALDVTSGHTNWATKLTLQMFYDSPPVAAAGSVFVDGMESGGTTYAIDAATGKTRWTADTFDGSDGTVAVVDNVVYEAEACGQVSAFDLMTGKRNWFHSGACTGGGGSTPAVAGGRIWVRDWAEGNIILDLAGNAVGTFSVDVPPSLHDGTAFYVKSQTLTAIDIASNLIKWSFAGDKKLCTSAVIAGGGGQVFCASSVGNVYEVDESSGAQISVDVAGSTVSCGSETQGMAVAQNHLFVPAGNDLVVY